MVTAASPRTPYRAVLAIPEAKLLIGAMAPVRLGYAMAGLAMVLLIRDRTGSFILAGLGLGLFSFAAAVLAPLRGHLVDTLGQTKPLSLYLPVFCCAFGLLPLARAPWLLMTLCTISGAMSPPLLASSRALWRPIVGAELLRPAYAVDAVSMQVSAVLGPAAAAALVAAAGGPAAIWCVTALVAIGGALFVAIPASRRWRGDPAAGGFRGAVSAPGVRTLIGVAACTGTALGAITLALTGIAQEAGSTVGAGLLIAALALGSAVGGGWAGARTIRRGPAVGMAMGLGVLATCLLIATLASASTPLAIMLIVGGLGLGPANVYLLELIDRSAPLGSQVAAFAAVVAVEGGFVGLGSLLAGRAADAGGAHAGLVVAGVAEFLAAAILLMRRRSLSGRAAADVR